MDQTTLRCLPELIYPEIYTGIAVSQAAPRGVGKGFSWTDSPYAVWGRACFGLDLADSDGEALRELAEKALELGCLISTGPACKPENAEAILESAGFVRKKESAGMVLSPATFRPRACPAGMRIDAVSSAVDWSDWAGIVCRNLFQRENGQDAADFAKIGKTLASSFPFRAFLGRDERGRALATSAALDCACGSGGVFFVAVEKDFRKRGYGAALTSLASAECFDSGFSYATLSATEDGRPVYEGLGYTTVSMLGRYAPPQAC